MDNITKLKRMSAQGNSMANEESLITKDFFKANDGHLPLIIKPRFKGVHLVNWLSDNRADFEEALGTYGGILFRGFPIETLSDFGAFVASFKSDPLPYMFRSSPRQEIDKGVKHVYNSTIYPHEEHIKLHNESSYSRSWGMKIVFCCLQPAEEGGETPIADSRKVLKAIAPEIVAKFSTLGVLYKRTLIKDVGMSWQEVFQTEEEAVVKEICEANDIQYEFVTKDHLEIQWHKKAVYQHPVSGDETWFNHIYFFNKFSRYDELGVPYEEEVQADLLHSNTLYGDGSEISLDEYLNIKQAYATHTVSFMYEKGDILFLDNMLVAHGRNPFKGNRLIATAIMGPAADQESSQSTH